MKGGGERRTMNIGFLGCGYAARIHSRTLRHFRGEVACHYASRDRARAEDFARRHGGAGAYGSYEEALGDDGIDVVLNLLPPALHLEWTLRALAAGKDVIVEKPPFLRARDFDEVERAAQASGGRVFIAENYFYKPLLRRLRQLLAEDAVGEVLFVELNAVKRQASAGNWRDDAQLAGGGALYEGGIHWINFLSNLGLTVRRVHGFRPGAQGPSGAASGVDRSMLVVLEYAEGAVGTLAYSWEVPSTLRGVRLSRIHGRKGSILFESNGLFVTVNAPRRRIYFPGLGDLQGYRGMFRDFIEAWRSGREPELTLALARRDLELVEAAYRSAERPEPPQTLLREGRDPT